MDEKETNIPASGSQPENYHNAEAAYVPKHEKEAFQDSTTQQSSDASQQNMDVRRDYQKLNENPFNRQTANTARPIYGSNSMYNQQPRYDAFMYEPIGFEELERQGANEASALLNEKQHRSKGDKIAVVLFALLFLAAIVISIIGISRDVSNSEKAIDEIVNSRQIVFYRESKPDGANDISNFVDENGKYTIEGAAAHVRSSIVEIYTYGDAAHETLIGTGSGVVLTEDGYIVTNAHVLNSNGYHTVTTVDGETFDAKIVGRDAKTDIAVIKASNAKLVPATLGDSDEAIVGEPVIAVGNPAGLSNTVTDGIISAINRKIRSDSTGFEMDCIQTNADISPGNSGGALVNMYGQVIGITSSKYVSDSFEGLGFAISINEATPIIEELISNGYISGRFRIGISLLATDNARADIEAALGYELPEDFTGIYIVSISEDSDILNTDLEEGDFITEINGKSVKSYNEFYDTISSMYGAGDTVPATCAHVDEEGNIMYYNIEFKLLEDTSGDY